MTTTSDPDLCPLCPKLCRFACPVANGTADEGATPTAMLQAAADARAGRLPWSEAATLLDRCTGCEACRAPCEYEQDVPAMLYEARAEAFAAGAASPGARRLHESMLEHGSPQGVDLRARMEAALRDRADLDSKGRVLYWPGCRVLSERPEQAAAAMALFRSLGADHLSLPARDDVPSCCGAPLRVIGDRTGFQAVASGLQQYFNRQRTWVSPSCECLLAVRDGYAEAEQDIRAELLHVAEYLLFFRGRLGDLGRAAMERMEREDRPLPALLVHDACGLHRRLGAGEAVYEVLEAATGTRPPSIAPYPDRAGCCGAGDFFDLRRPDAAPAVAAWSLRDADLPDGAWVVTGDAGCVASLQAALPGARVMDLVGFLLAWLGAETA